MSRRHSAEKREINPDAKYGNLVISKFMNSIMLQGKKSVAESIVYGALETIEAKAKSDRLWRPRDDRSQGQVRSAQGLRAGARERDAVDRGALPPRRRRHLSGAGGSAHFTPAGAGDPLAPRRCARPISPP